MRIARVALDVPLDQLFDFGIPEGEEVSPGALVVVPFGRSRKVGTVVARASRSAVPLERLRAIESVVKDVAPLGAAELKLFTFCAHYYHRALGEVIAMSLAPRLRQVRRRALVAPSVRLAADSGFRPSVALTPDQEQALSVCREGTGGFYPVLLQGVTGSGKTEVYLRLIAETLARGRQALLLVPEIGLTPQLEEQVRARFPQALTVAAHSHLAEGKRALAWLQAQSGSAQIVLGTRLAVLLPFFDLGLIIVDEEHDASYKQQEGVRYSARDVAVRRAQNLGIPVVLGSATPSLESYANALAGRYALARLPSRAAAGAAMPRVRTVDTRADLPHEGLSYALREAIRVRLAQREQTLIFVNRRGFSPVLYCRTCAWHSSCQRCSANLVLHLKSGELRCHHCGHRHRIPQHCPDCGSAELAPVGQGTQRVEDALSAAFPAARLARVDRDSTARQGSLKHILEQFRSGALDILVGTQMLAKGHDYPRLTLVGVLNSDSALFSADFRASERLYSQLVQVAGRSGRAERAGEVLIQTDFPGHPLYAAVAHHDFGRFADEALEERRAAELPPFTHLALLRAESKKSAEALDFLKRAARLARTFASKVEVFDPVPAPLERKAGFERAQLLVRARSRAALQPFLREWTSALLAQGGRHVRWSLDVDPQEV